MTTSKPYDWSKFRTRIPVKAGIRDIYNAWTTKNGIERWFLKSANFVTAEGTERTGSVQKGDSYTWTWFGYGEEVNEKGTILEANGRDFFSFSFAGECKVSVYIQDEAGEVVVELVQSNIPTDEKGMTSIHIGCMGGWTFYLANLKSYLEGGIDLRNKNVLIKNVISS
ncbi:SRPBCC domain-containing protein [uncultured Chitinophaga sp.]|uniref:SRPBCC family protein n=1 Tax=uncultured Chitinophaga sp. TaxID=339340 RepID=UPI0025CB7802|nr:SRPBCC domain-containing protein [uncultured Chitinophaga sp.]